MNTTTESKTYQLYYSLVFANNHNGNELDLLKRQEALLKRLQSDSDLTEDERRRLTNIWFDQVSKNIDKHYNMLCGWLNKFKELGLYDLLPDNHKSVSK
jgi:hypothetical protein